MCLFTRPLFTLVRSMLHVNLDCLKRVSVKCKYYPDLLSTKPKARSGQLIKFNSQFYILATQTA